MTPPARLVRSSLGCNGLYRNITSCLTLFHDVTCRRRLALCQGCWVALLSILTAETGDWGKCCAEGLGWLKGGGGCPNTAKGTRTEQDEGEA
ncbi:unnamed protein product [Gongylonema pulchrum]|uniref:Secreted protein n=1 Tax=Gongylonema pulchrum TaxID=637853 RepID=A0A183EMF1_9BILA|nr:unnamed protein product [Gongylonema pulchrum]